MSSAEGSLPYAPTTTATKMRTTILSMPSPKSSPPVSPLTLPGAHFDCYSSLKSPPLDPILENVKADYTHPPASRSRVGSVSSISFNLKGGAGGGPTAAGPGADGLMKKKKKPAPRTWGERSPPPSPRFQHHVSFDNFAGGEPTAKNSISFTLNVKHTGYQRKRRSRTFMVGVDENDYSDIALSWMLEELVDDGDEVICLRVVDKDAKVVSDRNVDRKTYQEEAKRLMERIQSRNDEHRAISIVLEYSVGKVHSVFQKMIQLYEPAMLIVGTRGRSLGGFQGLMNMSNSFSKWCLQYSPIPVVVVRPTEKRTKKKKKRDADPSRQDYARILRESGLAMHEIESGSGTPEIEFTNTPDVEAHAVAAALGLPAQFDPTLKPLIFEGNSGSRNHRKTDSTASDGTSVFKSTAVTDSRPSSPGMVIKNPKVRRESADSRDSNSLSGDEESSDEEEGEFEVVSGHDLLDNGERQMKLHEMEVGEAAALAAGRKVSVGSADSDGSVTLPIRLEDESPPAVDTEDEMEKAVVKLHDRLEGDVVEAGDEKQPETTGTVKLEKKTQTQTAVGLQDEKEAMKHADTVWTLGVQSVLMTLC
ncbi:uncharacterized protein L3040_004500 [Drepanopeziza brunnea f. sp. 'multigermtubi']|nr:hypothetical protein L3040_004500 [Drepanopeziza brunnea f. sp. 'multigermtubi']